MAELMSGQGFLKDLPDHLAKSTERVVLGTMFCAPGEKLDQLRDALKGVDGLIRPFIGTDSGGNANVLSEPNTSEGLQDWRAWCEANNVDFALLGESKWRSLLPSAGRLGLIGANHSRVVVIDDVFTTGDSSFMDDADDYNLMMRIPSRLAADWAEDRYRYRPHMPHPESIVRVDSETSIIADDNRPLGGSLILDTALSLVSDQAAHSVVTTGQFAPNGRMLKALVGAHERGRQVESYYGNFEEPRMEGFAAYYRNRLQRAKPQFRVAAVAFTTVNAAGEHEHRPLHSKSLGIDIPAPDEQIPESARVLVGSHDFTSLGGLMGVEECAVMTSSHEVIRNYGRLVQKLQETWRQNPEPNT